MNKVEKKLDVLCLGAAVVDIPLRPVSRDIFDIESYPVEQIAMAVGGDAMNESTIISRLGSRQDSWLRLVTMQQELLSYVLVRRIILIQKGLR